MRRRTQLGSSSRRRTGTLLAMAAVLVATACTSAPGSTTPTNAGAAGNSTSNAAEKTGGADDTENPGADTSSSTAPTGTLNAYLYQKPKQFSPLAPSNGPDEIVMSLVFDSLLITDPEFQLEPSLAAEMPSISSDGKTFTFTLRSGLTWSDGTAFTSADVLFSYNLLANKASGSASSGNFSLVEGFDQVASGDAEELSGFSAPDEQTFVINTVEPSIGLLALIGRSRILPEHILGDVPLGDLAKHPFFNAPTVGLGPYNFVKYETDQYVELQANPMFRDPVNIEKIFLKPVTSDVATAQLGTGEMDMVQISPTDLPAVESMSGVTIESKQSAGFIRIGFNYDKDYFQDPRIRQAMLHGIDRAKIVSSVIAGKGTVVNSTFMGNALPEDLDSYEYDPAKAKELLKAAGWDNNRTISLAWIPGQRDRDTTATIVQTQLAEIGVNVELKQGQAAELLDSYADRSFDMALYGGGNTATDPWSANPLLGCDQFYPDNGSNIPHYCQKELSELMIRANATTDEAKRTELYRDAARLENKDASYIWLYNPDTIWAFGPRLSGYTASGDFTLPFYHVADWKISS